MAETSFSFARQHFARICDQAAETREPVIIRRRNADDVAIVAADELSSLLETAYLLRSPKNAARLIEAWRDAMARQGEPTTIDELRRAVGLEADE
jgi:antitoxin YefM